MKLGLSMSMPSVAGRGTSAPFDPDALLYAESVPSIGSTELSRLSKLFRVLKGEAVPGLQQLSKSYWPYLRGGWILEGKYQTVSGDANDAMGEVASFDGDWPLTPTALYWGNYGTRMWNYDGVLNRALRTSTRFLQDNERWCFIVVGNFLNYGASQQNIICQNVNSSAAARHTPLLVSAAGGLQNFLHNGGGVITTDTAAGSAYTSVPRSVMVCHDDTHLRIYLDGSATEAVAGVAVGPAVISDAPLTIGNSGGNDRGITAGTVNMVFPFASADAAGIFSGADYAALHIDIQLIFREGLHGTDSLRPVPGGRSYQEIARVPSVTAGGVRFFGSPTILNHDGDLYAFHDEWGAGGTEGKLWTYAYDGDDWTNTGSTTGMLWGSPFMVGETMYCRGVNGQTASNALFIRSSADYGATWSAAVQLSGSGGTPSAAYHMAGGNAPMLHNGRYYLPVEQLQNGGGGAVGANRPKSVVVLSFDAEDDPMDPDSWAASNVVDVTDALRGTILGTAPDADTTKETLEHVLFKLGGTIYMLGRTLNMGNLASVWSFDPDTGAPGGTLACTGGDTDAVFGFTKFCVVPDEVSGVAFIVGNEQPAGSVVADNRVRLCLFSFDGTDFTKLATLVDFGDIDAQESGWHYPDAVIVGDDLHVVARGAWNGARSYHDTSSIPTFTVRNFRNYLS